MQSILQSALACVVGAVEITTDPSGVTFHRSPSTARARLGDIGLDSMSAVPAGVRIEALTDASALEFDVELTEFLILGATSSGSAFDLALDGELRDPVITKEQTLVVVDPVTWAMEHQPAGPVTLRFDLGASGTERRVEIWLPAGAMLKLLDVRITDGSSLRPAPATGPLWVHHGSSVSQCAEADRPTETWPVSIPWDGGDGLCHSGPQQGR